MVHQRLTSHWAIYENYNQKNEIINITVSKRIDKYKVTGKTTFFDMKIDRKEQLSFCNFL